MVATIEKSLLHKVKSERDKQTSYINTYIWNLERGTDERIYRAAMETQT